MENLKIRVNSEAERKQAQELFVVLGAACCSGLERNKNVNFLFMNSGFVTACKLQENFDKSKCKEITIPELRDLVVLKRNDVGDANYECNGEKYFLSSLGENHCWHKVARKGVTVFEWVQCGTPLIPEFKPIEKTEMKEYLMPSEDYKLIKAYRKKGNDWIEIPEGAISYARDSVFGNKRIDFYKDGAVFIDGQWMRCNFDHADGDILWQRHTHPEELPFIDDECYTNKSDGVFSLPKSEPCDISDWVEIRGDSPNSQYAEIEKVRQSAWQKQEGGNHYKNLKIQPMQYALENKLDYAQANVVKYVTRHKEKNGKEDLLKAIHNIELMIEFYYGDEK